MFTWPFFAISITESLFALAVFCRGFSEKLHQPPLLNLNRVVRTFHTLAGAFLEHRTVKIKIYTIHYPGPELYLNQEVYFANNNGKHCD